MNITARKFVLSLFVLFFTFLTSLAAPGDLDTTFGGTGMIRTGFGSANNTGRAVALQPDGKIIVVGDGSSGGEDKFALARYNPNGSLDPSFGAGGIVTTAFNSVESQAYAVALQADGKIVAAGYVFTGFYYDFAVARYNTDGTLDNTFDGDGKVITTAVNRANGVAIQLDGKIVVVGDADVSFALVRYNPDGSLDQTFDGDGIVITNSAHNARAVALQPDGKIVAVGRYAHNFAVARFLPDGSLDASFDGDGVAVTSVRPEDNHAYAVALQADGKIVAAGYALMTRGNRQRIDFALVRFNPNGSLDTSFDGDGKVITLLKGDENFLNGIAVQPDGKIVAVGLTYGAAVESGFVLIRYNPNGSLDATFGMGGKVITPFPNYNGGAANAVTLQPDGKIIAAGSVGTFNNSDFALARYNQDGSLDSSQFGTSGLVTSDFGDSFSYAHAVVVQPDNKIIAGGYVDSKGFGLARYNVNGTLDAAFGSGGKVTLPIITGFADFLHALALQPDGKIVAAGSVYNNITLYRDIAVARFNADGSPDLSFDGDGKVTTTPPPQRHCAARAVAIQPDGKIVIAASNGLQFMVLRYLSNGSLDPSFDGDGIATILVGTFDNMPNALALQPDGKIVIAGYTGRTNGGRSLALARLNSDGSPDAGFGSGGKVSTMVGPQNDYFNGVVLQPDGKIIAAGTTLLNSDFDFTLVRYNTNGSLDMSFGTGGIARGNIGGSDVASAVRLQPDGKIVVAGTINDYVAANYGIARFNSDGSFDTSFGTGGKAIFDLTGRGDYGNALALDSIGRMIIAGDAGQLFGVARVLGGNIAPSTGIFDYDGDGRADISVFRPSVGEWYIARSSDGVFSETHFGANGDLIAPADYDGDRKTDICVFRPSAGTWYRLNSSNNSFTAVQFGAPEDLAVPGDFDGDGHADLSIYRASAGSWYRLNSSDNQSVGIQFGAAEDKPIVGDFDGDRKSDLAVFRPLNGTWYRINSSDGSFSTNQLGALGDLPVAADYDGDGKTDLAIYRPSVGDWYVIKSSNSSFTAIHFGVTEDKPAPADYDGDGKADLAVFRPSSGTWYLLRTTAGFTGIQFGASGDIPTPNAFVR